MLERKLVLASHGKLASGMNSSLKLIFGGITPIETLDCYLTEDFDLEKAVSEIMERHRDHELVVVTDLFGGSVNNEFLAHINRADFYLVAGMNLPFLVEFAMQFQLADSLSKLIETTLTTAKQSIQFCNQLISSEIEEEDF